MLAAAMTSEPPAVPTGSQRVNCRIFGSSSYHNLGLSKRLGTGTSIQYSIRTHTMETSFLAKTNSNRGSNNISSAMSCKSSRQIPELVLLVCP